MLATVIAALLFVAIPPVLVLAAGALHAHGWVGEFRARWRATLKAARPHAGPPVLALVIALAGYAAVVLGHWGLGKGAKAIEDLVDWPTFHWFEERLGPGGWTDLWNLLTQMGNRGPTQRITMVGVVLFAALAVLRARRNGGPSRWYVPVIVLPAAYLAEKSGQMILSRVVDRGHPPTTLGTWPSGGCARLIVVYGLFAFFLLHTLGAGRRSRILVYGGVGALAGAEAYSRTYLLKHWLTDVLGGLTYGMGLLVVAVAAASVLIAQTPVEVLTDPEP